MTLGLLALTILIFALLLDRRDRRAHEERCDRATQAIDENNAHRMEVLGLLQRIQAPELAVVEHQQAQAQEAAGHPPTDEQLAEEQAKAAFLQRVEQIENENAGLLA